MFNVNKSLNCISKVFNVQPWYLRFKKFSCYRSSSNIFNEIFKTQKIRNEQHLIV